MSPFNKVFKRKINELISSGMVEYMMNARKPRPPEKVDEGPKQLTMSHLGICFITIVIFLVISIVVFIGEICIHYSLTTKKATPKKMQSRKVVV